jgi:two-component system NtrC family sensor kinase
MNGPLRVLIIEDSESDAELLLLELRRGGYRVVHERVQTAAGLNRALLEDWDIALSDYSMPGFSGTQALREIQHSGKDIPFIIVSGTIGEDAAVSAMHAGADDFLVKGKLGRLAPAIERSRRQHEARLARRRAERALLESEEGYRAMFEQAAVGIARVAPGGRWLEVNQRLCDIVGYSQAELLERTFQDITHPDDLDADLELVQKVLSGELRTYTLEKRYIRKDGTLIWIDLTVSLVQGDAGPKYFVSVVQDISARKAAQAEAQMAQRLRRANEELQAAYRELQATQAQLVQAAKMASLGELVAGVAHEVNNPLAFVMSHLDTVHKNLARFRQELTLPPPQAAEAHWQKADQRFSEVIVGLRRIRDLVLKLRTFSRLDEGERIPASVSDCVDAVLTILGHLTKDRIKVETELTTPDILECYPALLNQALLNLVANAIDAIEGVGTIAIKTEANEDTFVITVSDTGCGVPSQIRERIFEPFVTTKEVGRGTGLGLSITHSIIERHEGTLTLDDAPGGGTVATVRLPVRGRDDATSPSRG